MASDTIKDLAAGTVGGIAQVSHNTCSVDDLDVGFFSAEAGPRRTALRYRESGQYITFTQ